MAKRREVKRDWSEYWLCFRGNAIPASMQPHPEFLGNLQRGQRVLDIGCGFGRISKIMANKGCQVVGIDINQDALREAQSNNTEGVDYRLMSGANMSAFGDNSFDTVVLFGTLGGVQKELREAIIAEAVRVLKPNGTLYAAELARKHGDSNRDAKYEEDATKTEELGSRVVYRRGGKNEVLFVAKHFEDSELIALMEQHGLQSVKVQHHIIEKHGITENSTEQREQLSVWAVKPPANQ